MSFFTGKKMRKVILDTQIFLWCLTDDVRLSAKLRAAVIAPRQTVFLSAASLWEIAIKESSGKLELSSELNFQKAIERFEFVLLPIELTHLEKLRKLPFRHKDPFDRMLIAQAQAMKAVLLTVDKKIKGYQVETELI
jgi:PIN domain nuclease of toxin-antitoxin system